jgi:uncharacterized protein YggT (Ycf19 family)
MSREQHVSIDEAERIRRHESVKSAVRDKVHADVREQVETTPADRANEEAAAEVLKQKAVREIGETEAEIERGRSAARTSQILDYVFYLVYGIIGLAIVLEAIGARESAGFKQFIDALAAPLVAPFRGIMPDPGVGSFRLMLSYMVALAVYLLLHMAINGLLRIMAERKTAV